MSRRPVNPSRRIADSGSFPFSSSFHQKSKTSPLLTIVLVLLAVFMLIIYSYSGPHSTLSRFQPKKLQPVVVHERESMIMKDQEISCTGQVEQAIPLLKEAYGNSMRKVLHVGPETCSVVSKLLKEEDTEAWGIEPYEMEDAESSCKLLVRNGIVRVADIKFPLPYTPKSFTHVIVSDALDYLSPTYMNKTLPDLARVSSDGLIIFAGYPGKQRAKVSELSKFGRPAKLRSKSWWNRYFIQNNLEENNEALKKFDKAAEKISFKPSCQIFHLNS